ncbi:LexA family protein [Halomonas caseinilytica]|uniref:LexA family protein n=1 Tax=Halomonas caseinilytica TaxID=438744 RepID=UPI0007E591A1|nr:S24 family peptidase [Halomonas caseinilytica]
MKEISQIRLENARKLAEQVGGTGAFAARIDRESTQASRFMGKKPTKNIGDRMARHIEESFNKPRGWLDTDRSGDDAGKVAQHPTLHESNVAPPPKMEGYVPVISWVQAGSWTEVCNVDAVSEERVPRPPGSSDRTFALRVKGQSMAPKYEPGLIIYVDPEVMPFDGDDVVAVLTESNEATFKQFVEEPGFERMLKARNPSWPDPYISINGNCEIIGVVIGSLWLRKPRV